MECAATASEHWIHRLITAVKVRLAHSKYQEVSLGNPSANLGTGTGNCLLLSTCTLELTCTVGAMDASTSAGTRY